jgi:predicted CXXCH cytochrome family protein
MVRVLFLAWSSACVRSPEWRDSDEIALAVERTTLRIEVEAEKHPVDGAWITLDPSGRDGVTGDDGAVVLEGLGEGTYTVYASALGLEPASVVVDVAGEVTELHLVLVVATPVPALTGLVLGPTGDPIAGAHVWVDGEDLAATSADGTFSVMETLDGPHAVEITAPELVAFRHDGIETVEGGTVTMTIALAGMPPPNAVHIGSEPCRACHVEIGEAWSASVHARAARAPNELDGDPLADAVADGASIALAGGAVVVIGALPVWWIEVRDALGASTGPLPVVEVYGGHLAGAAFAVEWNGTRVLAPIAWALASQGLSSQQLPPGFVPAWEDGWFDGGGALAPDDAAISFDLRCAGCHATGAALEESDGLFALATSESTGTIERVVGCEACHGPGDAHRRGPDRKEVILQPARLSAERRHEVCARCHERSTPLDHPFSATPGWPVDSAGEALRPTDRLLEHAAPHPFWWAEVDASRVYADEVAELELSPHRRGPFGYDGSCEDCHDPHGSARPASLWTEPWDNALCTGCHQSRFPTTEAEAEHANHTRFEPGPFSPGACTGCHFPRSGLVVRLDPVSWVGELHAHGIDAWHPHDSLAEFELAETTTLGPGEVAVGPCLDCHMNVDAALRDESTACPCPRGDLGSRTTYENLGEIVDDRWGAP